MRSAFTRPVDIPGAIIEAALGMTHRALAGTARASDDYLRQRSLPDRLAALGLPVLVIFGADDQRCAPRRLPPTAPCPAPESSCCPAWDTPR